MSIEDLRQKIKGIIQITSERVSKGRFSGFRLPILSEDLVFMLVIMLVAFGSFGLGRLSKIEGAKVPIQIQNAPEVTKETFSGKASNTTKNTLDANHIAEQKESGKLVGSRTGSKYHYPWCSGASRIAEANRLYFASKAEAEKAGYTPAANCKGL